MRALRETDIVYACLGLLKAKRIFAWRVNSGTMRQGAGDHERFIQFNTAYGHSDIAGVLSGGRALFVEVKKPGGRVTTWQRSFLDRAAQSGALAIVVHSTVELADALKAEGYR